MAADDTLGPVKTDNDITTEGEKATSKEHFTLEGSVLINIRQQLRLPYLHRDVDSLASNWHMLCNVHASTFHRVFSVANKFKLGTYADMCNPDMQIQVHICTKFTLLS